MAREAAACGITSLAATPHVRDDYPTTADEMLTALAAVRHAVHDAGIDLDILPGAEIAFDQLHALDADDLRPFALGGSPNHLLIELPFFGWPLDTADQLRRLRELGYTDCPRPPRAQLGRPGVARSDSPTSSRRAPSYS